MSDKNQAFFDFFYDVYGDRWEGLLNSLKKEEFKIARYPRSEKVDEELFVSHRDFGDCYVPNNGEDELSTVYYLDFASVVAARSLGAKEHQSVLDLCAAPGGKSLVLAYDMNYQGNLICNELSRNRRERLKKVLRLFVPESFSVTVKGLDGSQFGMKFPNRFDKILVDAPCSGERHLLKSQKELMKWSRKRSKRLAARQYGLLCSALLALKSGGSLVYSTCSLSPFENDGVIERLLKKKGDNIRLENDFIAHQWKDLKMMEKTTYGLMFLPDKAQNMGPLYFSKIRKLP